MSHSKSVNWTEKLVDRERRWLGFHHYPWGEISSGLRLGHGFPSCRFSHGSG